MGRLQDLTAGVSRWLDKIAGACMVLIMLLVVANVVLRAAFNYPILGTYEYVSDLAALMIGLSLAYCAAQDGHIAVTFAVEKVPRRGRALIHSAMNAVSLLFWLLVTWHLGKYAFSMVKNGIVSPTTRLPFYPFIYLVAFGTGVLCLVILAKLVDSLKKGGIL